MASEKDSKNTLMELIEQFYKKNANIMNEEHEKKLQQIQIKLIDKVDPVNHPKHYTNHPSGIECIQVTEHMGFCLGNAVKYIWRADLKNDAIEDLRKAIWYIERELERRAGDLK